MVSSGAGMPRPRSCIDSSKVPCETSWAMPQGPWARGAFETACLGESGVLERVPFPSSRGLQRCALRDFAPTARSPSANPKTLDYPARSGMRCNRAYEVPACQPNFLLAPAYRNHLVTLRRQSSGGVWGRWPKEEAWGRVPVGVPVFRFPRLCVHIHGRSSRTRVRDSEKLKIRKRWRRRKRAPTQVPRWEVLPPMGLAGCADFRVLAPSPGLLRRRAGVRDTALTPRSPSLTHGPAHTLEPVATKDCVHGGYSLGTAPQERLYSASLPVSAAAISLSTPCRTSSSEASSESSTCLLLWFPSSSSLGG